MGEMKDKMSGKAKEMAGKMTHNKSLQYKGKVQHDIAEVKQKAKDIFDDMSDKLH